MKPRHVIAAAPQANAAGTPKVIVIVGENSTRAATMKGSPNLTKWATTYGQDTNCWAIRNVNSAHSSQSTTTQRMSRRGHGLERDRYTAGRKAGAE